MSSDPVTFALRHPGHLSFPSSLALAERFEEKGGRVVAAPTGHLVFYRPDGRRFLATDPAGHPLHECEWNRQADGTTVLTRARVCLDWGRWIGLVPGGIVNETTLDLARKPGWEHLTANDLRAMAARLLGVTTEDMQVFYADDNLCIDGRGLATIRHRKDALYVLEDGTFATARFMACMGAMHWDQIDFLPVVELFQSLLPGTGSAVFELIRGLYDDQNRGLENPPSLRYRGIPPYPSPSAWQLFSKFFVPCAPSGTEAFSIFMDHTRAHELEWRPVSDPPVRYFYDHPPLCLTVQGGRILKATLMDDPTGLSYFHPHGNRLVPWDRAVTVHDGVVELRDRQETIRFTVEVPGVSFASSEPVPSPSPVDWRSVFDPWVPVVDAHAVFGAVPLYPQDDRPIGEVAAQSFVADYLQDLAEQDREIAKIVSMANRILVENGDAAIATCLPFDRPRELVAVVRHPAFAIKQAQRIWTLCAEVGRWDWLVQAKFYLDRAAVPSAWRADLAYAWLPYEHFANPVARASVAGQLAERVKGGGQAFVVGPTVYRTDLEQAGFHLLWEGPVERLPTFAMHKTILPRATLHPGLTLFQVRR
ncbi:MAG: hypothetical protein NNA23_07030 [Nitrospira sp.]|nr:hypothetical protein [Nitrospira sp.]